MCHIQIGVYYRQEIVTTLDIMQHLGTVYIYGHNPLCVYVCKYLLHKYVLCLKPLIFTYTLSVLCNGWTVVSKNSPSNNSWHPSGTLSHSLECDSEQLILHH